MISSAAHFAAGFMGLGTGELVVILIILLVLFGGSKLPGLAKGFGQSIKEFKKASKEGEEEAKLEAAKKAEAAVKTPTPTPTPGATGATGAN